MSVAFAFTDYSLIADERGSFLFDGDEGPNNLDLNSFAAPSAIPDTSADVSDDMQNILAGLNVLTRPLPANPPPCNVETVSSIADVVSSAEDESSLLACSTASYRGYRDSPQRPVRQRLDFLAEEAEHERTPMKKGRSSNGSTGSGTSGDDSPDVASLWRGWKGDEMRTGEM